ncbi:hypothetical protein I204_00313 [Kwoniella mangroviensis CBS 8886]|nr:uncharacterized protein I203_02511 [Kwoniella mangroviensis CBS 8507]OCF67855.1 hypothetical protein I203_02511 [Kwoniella mangroviensis CBS 8507]OCF78373.1 hypothetical protein I204_00313 [Kwoniella mangroviensis CBS 8886]
MTDNALPPRCPCCHQQQHPLYCAACLREGIALHNEALKNIQAQIDSIIANATILLNGPQDPTGSRNIIRGQNAWRTVRAEVDEKEQRCAELRRTIRNKESKIETSKKRISDRTISQRRANLNSLQSSAKPEASFRNAIKRCEEQQRDIGYHIINARRVLVREAVNVFGLKKKSIGEWTIAGLTLPSPDALRLYPSTHINAALLHTIHLVSLITSYLSITLPFTPTPPSPFESRHIGRPTMKASTPFVGTTKWRDKNVLWMSSTASIASKLKSRGSLSASKVFAQPNISGIIAKSMNKHRQFLTSFALFSFSVAYMAWSQGVQGIGIPDGQDYRDDSDEDNPSRTASINPDSILISATSILELIAAISSSPDLGRRTHEPGTSHVLRHLGFGLDVAKVVQSVLSSEENRWGVKPTEGSGEDFSEGWDLLDGE